MTSVTLGILAGLLFGAPAMAYTETFYARSNDGVQMTLEIDSPVTTAATSALLCANTSTTLTEATLLLQTADGHLQGSTPTTIASSGNNCYRINGINFVVPGTWQIRIKLADGDRGTFYVPVGE